MAQDYVWQTQPICKGVNNTFPDTAIDDAELADSANYQIDLQGQGWLTKREGITKTDTNQRTATTYSIYDGELGNYYHNGTVVYDFAGTSLVTGMAAAFDSWASAFGYDLFVNGTDAQKTSNGTSFSAIASIPAGTKFIAAVNNFVYASTGNTKLRYCGYGDITDWNATYELGFTQNIDGLAECDNAVGIWAAKWFYMVMGYSNIDQNVSYYSKRDGLRGSARSIVVTPFGTFWWGLSGITWMKQGYSIDYPMLRKLAKTLAGLNRAYDSIVHAAWDSIQQRVMFWVANGVATTCNLRIDFYPYYDSFFLQTGAGVTMSASGTVTISGAQNIYVGGYNPTYLYKQSGLTDDGAAISAYFDTKREGSPVIDRSGRSVVIQTNLGATETISYSKYINNDATADTAVDCSIVAGMQDTVISQIPNNKRIKHRIADAATASRTKILGLTHTGTQDKIK